MRLMIAALFSVYFVGLASGQEFETFEEHIISGSQVEDFGEHYGAADASRARRITPLGLDLIKEFEGWRPRAYNDPAGYCTIGYGHLIALKRCEEIDLGEFKKPLSRAAGLNLLEKDTVGARLSVGQLVTVNLEDHEFSALVSFVFNVGQTKFASSTLRRLLNDEEKKAAERQFARWTKARGREYQGLINRRACETDLFQDDLAYNNQGVFNSSSCESLGAAPGGQGTIDIDVGEK